MNMRWAMVAAFAAAMACSGCSDDDSGGSKGDGGEPSEDDGGGGDGGRDGSAPKPDGGGPIPGVVCGDGKRHDTEGCDDANTMSGDGCSDTCVVELGYACPTPGKSCVLAVVCGDGQIGPGEVCDDMNVVAGDGCSGDCRSIETNYVCPTPGMLCVSTQVCGDGVVVGTEQCDDMNTVGGDGCSDNCQMVEQGWTCRTPGDRCAAAECGDGLRAGNEQCDDDDVDPGDGCGATCQIEAGWVCPAGMACRRTVCGDSMKEGSEQCDDGNGTPFDGCYNCQVEPNCGNNGCAAACGDGILFPGEECDDGNVLANDGCSPMCKFEQGYACTNTVEAPPAMLTIPIIYRDFRGYDLQAANGLPRGHIDFENTQGSETGIVGTMLGNDKKPVYGKAADGSNSTTTHGKATFDQWYRDTANVNINIPDSLTLTRQGDGSYRFDSTAFFPLNNRGWRVNNREPLRAAKDDAGNNIADQSFHFTSELRYWFEYGGGEVLDFRGDDDVWVFVNGRRVIDIGGVHGAQNASVTLPQPNTQQATNLGLSAGQIYEIVLFQAERHTTQSSYKLTLRGFVKKKTSCHSNCGDKIVTPDEACDDGTAGNTGDYGKCNPNCQGFGPRCGDAMVQADHGEQCDDGINLGGYGASACLPGCKAAPRCGDSQVDGTYGEQCDDGANDGGYNECGPGCQRGERCGDGVRQMQEECDDGNTNASDGCDNACKNIVVI